MKTPNRTTKKKPVKVILVDDSPIVLNILQRILAVDTSIEVVATAQDGIEALKLIRQFKPDVVCTDLHMPHMDGYELTKTIMQEIPLPILVISVSVQAHQDATDDFLFVPASWSDVF